MIEVRITKKMLSTARAKAKEMGPLKNSIRRGQGNLVGFLGEFLVAKIIGATIENTYNYDLIKGDIKIEVKSKQCSSPPLLTYEVSVAAYNTRQAVGGYYIFVRILDDYSKGWILGKKRKDLYFKQARFCKEGEIDEYSSLNWKFKADCYNLQIKDLSPIIVNKFS